MGIPTKCYKSRGKTVGQSEAATSAQASSEIGGGDEIIGTSGQRGYRDEVDGIDASDRGGCESTGHSQVVRSGTAQLKIKGRSV